MESVNDKKNRKAALALNLCTVSVSQIVEYEDLNILKQEYDAILNNLNLQQIVKDEALLTSIKSIMDVITFYMIQEGDQEIASREYQHKMKNAIFDSVSGMGIMIAGSPATMLIGLTTQAGIGYLNYRRSKARSKLEYEKQKWQLQRSAIEQLNGLRRSLFETAWRLSDSYDFPDEWRLSEKQIAKYNQILMDPDPHRQYDRLEALDDAFQAFPPFWYYKSRSALETAAKYEAAGKLELNDHFKQKALIALDKYDEAYFPLMREDIIAASAALDKFSLLDPGKDKDQMVSLLQRAAQMGKSEFDVLQMCAVNYIAIREPSPAVAILRNLVNEQYNIPLNGRLLSRLYNELNIKLEYNLLCDRIGEQHVMPWADSMEASLIALHGRNKDRVDRIAIIVFQKIFADTTQKLSSEFLGEITHWDLSFSDDKQSWKDRVECGEAFSSWADRIRKAFNDSYNHLVHDSEYRIIFGGRSKLVAAKLRELAELQSEIIDKLDEAVQEFQTEGCVIKNDTSMLGVPLHKAMKSPKSSQIVKYKASGHHLSSLIAAIFEELYKYSPGYLMDIFKSVTSQLQDDDDFDHLETLLEKKDRSMPLRTLTPLVGNDDLITDLLIETDFFGFRLFKEVEESPDTVLATALSSVKDVFKKK